MKPHAFLLVFLLAAVRLVGDPMPNLALNYEYTVTDTANITYTANFQVIMGATAWNEATRQMTVSREYVAAYITTTHNNLVKMRCGYESVSSGGASSITWWDSPTMYGLNAVDNKYTGTLQVPTGGKVRLVTGVTKRVSGVSDGWTPATETLHYSGYFSGGSGFRRLDFQVTNTGTETAIAGVWGGDVDYCFTNIKWGNVGPDSNMLAPGATTVVSHYVFSDETLSYCGAVTDLAATKVKYGGMWVVGEYYAPDGGGGVGLSGAVALVGSKTATKNAAMGAVVASCLLRTGTGVANTTQVPIAAGAGAVTGLGTGAASGMDIQAGANGVIAAQNQTTNAVASGLATLHSDMQDLKGSMDGTGTSQMPLDTDSRITGIGSTAAGKVDGYKGNFSSAQPYTGGARNQTSMTTPTYISSAWSVTLPAMGTISVDPMSDANLASGASFARGLASWFLVVGFMAFAASETAGIVRTLSLVQGTTSGPAVSIAGFTSSIPSALVKAGVLVTIVLAAVPAIYAAATGALPGFDWAAILGGAGPFASAGDGGSFIGRLVALADKFFPLGLACCCAINTVVLKLGGQVIVGGVAAAMRFAAA